jgi:hypothetical protein
MDISIAGFGAVVAIVTLATVLFTFSDGVAENWAKTLVKDAGISLPLEDPQRVVELDLRWRRRILVGAALGSGVAAVISAFPAVAILANAMLLAVAYGFVAGACIGGITGMARAVSARATHPGPAVRPSGASIRSFIGTPLIVLGLITPLGPLVTLGRDLYLNATIGLDPEGYTTAAELAARCILLALFAFNGPVIIAFLAIASRRRQAAVSRDLLAWDDALFSRQSWNLIYGAAYINVVVAFLPSPSWTGPGELEGYALPFVTVMATLFFAAAVALTKPWRTYLRTLWPDVEAARAEIERQARDAARSKRVERNAEFARARQGLPPLPRETAEAEAEREKYAPFGE